jgi:hypothetical protein
MVLKTFHCARHTIVEWKIEDAHPNRWICYSKEHTVDVPSLVRRRMKSCDPEWRPSW